MPDARKSEPPGAPNGSSPGPNGTHPGHGTQPVKPPAPLPRTPPMARNVSSPGFPMPPHVPGPAAYGAPPPSLEPSGINPMNTTQNLNTGPVAIPPGAGPGQAGQARLVVQFPHVGSTLTSLRGSYAVNKVIGSGEFGAVYESIGPFDQVYAIKMMRPANRPYAEVQADWAKEASRLVTLRHPNIVYIHDAFEENSLFYLALERCDHPLSAMLGAPMQEGLVIELGRQILAAVQFLHDNDVVHDDLHPGNVLITHHDRPIVKISDFGISNELRGMGQVRPNVVHHAIMAPEILVTGYTSRQSDLYQVGLLFYWMLTGASAIPKDAAYQDLVQMVADGAPRRRAEAIGTPLGALVAKMLRRRETYRYTSAREVWAELREIPAWKTRELFPPK